MIAAAGSSRVTMPTDWPAITARDEELEAAMEVVRETVRLGLSARAQAKLKVRQPLHEAVVVAAGSERAAIERLQDVVLEELNVKSVRYVSEADELGSYTVKPNYRTLGPRYGKFMPQVAAAVAALDPADLQEHWRRVDLTGCDALVLSACVQMPSLPSIDPVERACGLPVVAAATATTFAMLDALGLSTRIPCAGRLLGHRGRRARIGGNSVAARLVRPVRLVGPVRLVRSVRRIVDEIVTVLVGARSALDVVTE